VKRGIALSIALIMTVALKKNVITGIGFIKNDKQNP